MRGSGQSNTMLGRRAIAIARSVAENRPVARKVYTARAHSRHGCRAQPRFARMAHVYIRVWEYKVDAEHMDAFLAAYGSDGEWARLFQRGRGYVGTELYQGTDDQSRFLTVDRWADEHAWRAFLEQARETYDRLDEQMAHLTVLQHELLEG